MNKPAVLHPLQNRPHPTASPAPTVPLARFLKEKAELRLARLALAERDADLTALRHAIKRCGEVQEAVLSAVGREKRVRMIQDGLLDCLEMSDVQFGALCERLRMIADA